MTTRNGDNIFPVLSLLFFFLSNWWMRVGVCVWCYSFAELVLTLVKTLFNMHRNSNILHSGCIPFNALFSFYEHIETLYMEKYMYCMYLKIYNQVVEVCRCYVIMKYFSGSLETDLAKSTWKSNRKQDENTHTHRVKIEWEKDTKYIPYNKKSKKYHEKEERKREKAHWNDWTSKCKAIKKMSVGDADEWDASIYSKRLVKHG